MKNSAIQNRRIKKKVEFRIQEKGRAHETEASGRKGLPRRKAKQILKVKRGKEKG